MHSDNNIATAPSNVLENLDKFSDQTDGNLVESRTESVKIESVIERNDLSQGTVNDANDRSSIAEAILLDSISTNSGING